MSTRSIIAEPKGDVWRGRYCHSDGYPTWNGRQLWAIVQRDGVEEARKRLLHDRYGWSTIEPDTTADRDMGIGRQDGRFVVEAGYGIAYTTVQDQSSEDEWITHDGDKWGTEWAYVLSDMGLMVGRVGWKDDSVTFLTLAPWGAGEPDWEAIEQGVYASEELAS